MVKVAIVTAGDSGIGKASCVALARDGFDIGLTWTHDEAGAKGTAEEVVALGRRAELRQLDLRQLPAAVAVVDELAETLGGVDVFVNNAGVGGSTPFLDVSWDEWREILTVDLDGAFLCCQHAARRMVEQGRGGRIIAISSVHEQVPLIGSAPYCAAKGGLGMLVRVMAAELAEHGVTVHSIAPGEVSTPMTGQHDADPNEQPRPGLPMRRPGDAREIAEWVAFLAGAGGTWATGATYVVDGGLMLQAATGSHHLPDDSWRRP